MLNTYFQYQSRKKNFYELIDIPKNDEESYQYVVLIATEYSNESNGISITDNTITIDLRSALPSTFFTSTRSTWLDYKKKHT